MVVSEIWWVKCWLIGVCLQQGWTSGHHTDDQPVKAELFGS